jgi:hypothetical protein
MTTTLAGTRSGVNGIGALIEVLDEVADLHSLTPASVRAIIRDVAELAGAAGLARIAGLGTIKSATVDEVPIERNHDDDHQESSSPSVACEDADAEGGQDAESALIGFGIARTVAKRLASTRPARMIMGWLGWIRARLASGDGEPIASPTGYLVAMMSRGEPVPRIIVPPQPRAEVPAEALSVAERVARAVVLSCDPADLPMHVKKATSEATPRGRQIRALVRAFPALGKAAAIDKLTRELAEDEGVKELDAAMRAGADGAGAGHKL